MYFNGRLLMSGTMGIGAVGVDRLASVRSGIQYWPYVEEEGNPTTADDRDKFATYYRDWPGQDYAEQRYYDSTNGRFWTPDPLILSAADPKDPGSWNRYAYAGGDPVNRSDPAGLDSWMSTGQWTIPNPPPGFCSGSGDLSLAFLPAEVAGWMCPTFVAVAIATPVSATPAPCGQLHPLQSQAEAQEVAVLFGEDSWPYAPKTYDYASASKEDLYMLQVMYNQAAARRDFKDTPDYVASTISDDTYLAYSAGVTLLSTALTSPVGSSLCDHLISAEAAYSQFWSGNHKFSNVNKWGAVSVLGPAKAGQIQFAGTVFWDATGVVAKPPHKNPVIGLN